MGLLVEHLTTIGPVDGSARTWRLLITIKWTQRYLLEPWSLKKIYLST
jgi:hypothetical protein